MGGHKGGADDGRKLSPFLSSVTGKVTYINNRTTFSQQFVTFKPELKIFKSEIDFYLLKT